MKMFHKNVNFTHRDNIMVKESVESFDGFDKFDIDNVHKNKDVSSINMPSFFGCPHDEEYQDGISEIKAFKQNSDKNPSSAGA